MSEKSRTLRKTKWIWALLILCGAGWIGGRALRRDPEAIVPGEHWSWKTPEEAGFSSEKLAEFSQQVGESGCIVQGGEMIHSWGDITFRNDVASSCKPIYAFLTFKAIEAGLIGSLDDKILRWVPEIGDLNAELGYKDRAITFRHLLSQTSGYGLKEKPGEAFAYNDYATGLLVWTLFYRVYGRSPGQYDEVLNGPLLGEALGFEDRPTATHQNSPRGRIRISARDLARFALLYLRGGEWNGRRVLREDLFRLAMSDPLPLDFPRTSGEESEDLTEWEPIGGGKNEKGHAGCLGYYWWFNRMTPDGTRLLPDAPPQTFLGVGYGGQFAMIAVPELDLVVVWLRIYKSTGEEWSPFDEVGRFKMNKTIRELLAARSPPPP